MPGGACQQAVNAESSRLAEICQPSHGGSQGLAGKVKTARVLQPWLTKHGLSLQRLVSRIHIELGWEN
jgi:hypothetical protein